MERIWEWQIVVKLDGGKIEHTESIHWAFWLKGLVLSFLPTGIYVVVLLHQWKWISGWSIPWGLSKSFPEWPLRKVGIEDMHLMCSVTGIANIPGGRAECSASTQRWKEQNLPFSHHYSSSWAYHSAEHNHGKSWEVRTKREKKMIYGFDI